MISSNPSYIRADRFLATLIGLLVFVAGLLLDALLIDVGMPRSDALILSNFLTGVVAGIGAWLLMIREQERRRAAMRRFQVIADMNHHVRNALQVIIYYCNKMEQEPRAETYDAIERIKWSLTEVLPHVEYPDSFREPRPGNPPERLT
jgi:hypothetical protein